MRHINIEDLEEELRAKGIPELAQKLAERYHLDPMKRKAERNPVEWELLNAIRKADSNTGNA